MTTVVHHVLDPDGNPVQAKTVTITLMLRLDVAPDSYDLNVPDPFTGAPISRTASAVSDVNGLLSWNLVPNDQIVPSGTYYEVHGLGTGRTFLYVPASEFPVEMTECVLTLVELGSSNLVLVQGPRGRQGGDSTGGLGMPVATATLKGILALAGDLGGDADAPTVTSGVNHDHTSAQIVDATDLGTPGTVIRRDDNGDFWAAGVSFTGVDNNGIREPVFYNITGGTGGAFRLGNPNGALRVLPNNDDTTYLQTSQGHLAFTGLNGTQGVGLSFNFQSTTFTGMVISGSSADPTTAAQLAPKAYVDKMAATRAAIAGDLGGTPASPTVPGLANKANLGHTHPVTDLTATGTRDSTKYLRGDNVWAVPPGSGSGTWVNVKDYGAKVDGTTDDAAAIRSAIAALPNGGTVYFPPGVTLIGSAIVVPSMIRLVGAGKYTSVLRKNFTGGILLDFTGASTSTRCFGGGTQDLGLDGNAKTGQLLRLQYADHHNFSRTWFRNNPANAVLAVELWDTYFSECEWEYCGTSTSDTGAAVRLLGSATDSTNQIHFADCRWESSPATSVMISSNGGGHPPYGVWFNRCKFESGPATATTGMNGNAFIDTTNDVVDVHLKDIYLAADGIMTGGTAAYALIDMVASANMTIDGVHAWINGNAAQSVIYCWPGSQAHDISNIYVDAPTLPANGIIRFAGGTPVMHVRNVAYKFGQAGTLYTGTIPAGVILDDKDVTGTGIAAVQVLTQAAYTALATKSATTLYVIQG